MSKIIRNKRTNNISLSKTPGVMFLCEFSLKEIFTYPAMTKAYIKTGRKTDSKFEAICVGTTIYNCSYLGKRCWLNKNGFKKARRIGERIWNSNSYSTIQTGIFSRWISATNLRVYQDEESRYYLKYNSYEQAFRKSKLAKLVYIKEKRYSSVLMSNV